MKNYYDELEVSKTASKEVIEKVYKVLAKKYHPDTTKEIDKIAAEEKFKLISEAYEILSDDEKRKKYDLEFEQTHPTISYEEYLNIVNERDNLNTALNNLKNEFNGYRKQNNNSQEYYNTNQNASAQNTNTKKKTYYYTDTGKPASAFAYYKYKIKQFFSNIGLLLLSIVAAILIFNAFSDFNLFDLFIK